MQALEKFPVKFSIMMNSCWPPSDLDLLVTPWNWGINSRNFLISGSSELETVLKKSLSLCPLTSFWIGFSTKPFLLTWSSIISDWSLLSDHGLTCIDCSLSQAPCPPTWASAPSTPSSPMLLHTSVVITCSFSFLHGLRLAMIVSCCWWILESWTVVIQSLFWYSLCYRGVVNSCQQNIS